MITVLIMTCLNINGDYWCSKKTSEMSFSQNHYSVVLKNVEYLETKAITESGIQTEAVQALYGNGEFSERMKAHPKKVGCEVRFKEHYEVSSEPCSKIRRRFR